MWRGYLPDPEPDARGVRAYTVREGTFVEVGLLNRGVEVDVEVTCREAALAPTSALVRLAPGADKRMAKFRVGRGATVVCVETQFWRPLGVHLRFASDATADGTTGASSLGGSAPMQALLAELGEMGEMWGSV